MAKAAKLKIVKDKIMSRSPRIDGTRIRVRDIVEKYILMKEPPAVIAREFGISISDVHEALSYYYENTEEIQEEIRKDKEFIDKFRKEPEDLEGKYNLDLKDVKDEKSKQKTKLERVKEKLQLEEISAQQPIYMTKVDGSIILILG